MSVRDCLRDMAAAHSAHEYRSRPRWGDTHDMRRHRVLEWRSGSAHGNRPRWGDSRLFHDMRSFMEHFHLAPSRNRKHSSRVSEENLNKSEIAFDVWIYLMCCFYEEIFQYFAWEKVEVSSFMRFTSGTQGSTTTFTKMISPFRVLLDRVGRPFERTTEDVYLEMTREVTELLRLSVDIADSYYRFHLLKFVYQSPNELSRLLEWGDIELEMLVEYSSYDESRFEHTEIYFSFHLMRDNLIYTLARKRGLVPSSFYVTDIVRRGNDPIGRGGFADIWAGYDMAHSQQNVALKVLKTFDVSKVQLDTLKALCREAVLWRKTEHPNVLSFIGICKLDDERLQSNIALASPFMKNGNLLKYVEKNTGADRVALREQTLCGLRYLHTIDIIHGDLKCSNVLVNDEGIAQLSDFGLSSIGNDGECIGQSMSNSAGNPRWLAPELLFPEQFKGSGKCTRESDVYAFGMTVLELFTGKVPFFELPDPAVPLEVAIKGLKPSWPGNDAEARGLTRDYWSIMEECWCHEPRLRPVTIPSTRDPSGFVRENVINMHFVGKRDVLRNMGVVILNPLHRARERGLLK